MKRPALLLNGIWIVSVFGVLIARGLPEYSQLGEWAVFILWLSIPIINLIRAYLPPGRSRKDPTKQVIESLLD